MFVDFVKINNKQARVFQSQDLYLRATTRKINFPGHKLKFHDSRPNSGLFHGREQNFQIQGLFPFSRVRGNPDWHLSPFWFRLIARAVYRYTIYPNRFLRFHQYVISEVNVLIKISICQTPLCDTMGVSILCLAWLTIAQQWPLLLTWFNFNPSMDK